LKRRYDKFSDWSDPEAVKINRNGKPLDPPVVPDQIELSDGSIPLTDGCKEHMI
jgi:hypothetical protein